MNHVFQQIILKGGITPYHLINGITLEEISDEMLALKKDGKIITPYSARGAKVQMIRKDADEYLERIGK